MGDCRELLNQNLGDDLEYYQAGRDVNSSKSDQASYVEPFAEWEPLNSWNVGNADKFTTYCQMDIHSAACPASLFCARSEVHRKRTAI